MITNKTTLYPILCILAFIAFSYTASLIFYFFAKIPASPMPWDVWIYLIYALQGNLSNLTISQLSLALGIPIAAAMFGGTGIYILLKGKNSGLPNARWANKHDIKKSKLAGNNGVILGKYNGNYIMSNSPTYVMVMAPTRSGKGIGVVLPNLLNFNGTIICLDIKHENFDHTAAFRSSVGKVYKWSPTAEDGHTHRYNPFDLISKDEFQRITDLQILATTLMPEPPHGDSVWAEEAQALFVGLALYIFETEENPTIGKVKRLMAAEGELGDICRHILDSNNMLPSSVVISLRNFIHKAAKERSGVKTSINKALKLWDNPIIDSATSASDFDITTLRSERQTIYVSVRIDELKTLAPLLRIFFEQIIKKLVKKKPDLKKEPHQVLMLLDEFHMLGYMQIMTDAFSVIAGFNVRMMIVAQSLNWLDTVYDKNTRNGILSCCAHQIFFATNDMEGAEFVSRRCGQKTIPVESTSSRNSWNPEAKTKNISYRTIPLIAPSEVAELNETKEIIIVEKGKPIMADKIIYDNEPGLTERAQMQNMPKIPKIKIQEAKIIEFSNKNKLAKSSKETNQSDMLTNGLIGENINLNSKLPKEPTD